MSSEWINEALRLGIHETWVKDIFDEFKDYWVNEARGKEALRANWFRVWSNRCRSQLSWTTKNPHPTNQKTLTSSELIPVAINESDSEVKVIREKILEILGAATYQSWFQNAVILKQTDRVTIETNRSLFRDTIERQYRAKIEEHIGIAVQVCLKTGAGA
ncbi:MAG: hypothetical protein K0M45_07275 [Candidatus Paracaedibacteraceae bacterium]|nr:hypothetical protein [Candidatus Paracaedibacteraceae bacterium]